MALYCSSLLASSWGSCRTPSHLRLSLACIPSPVSCAMALLLLVSSVNSTIACESFWCVLLFWLQPEPGLAFFFLLALGLGSCSWIWVCSWGHRSGEISEDNRLSARETSKWLKSRDSCCRLLIEACDTNSVCWRFWSLYLAWCFCDIQKTWTKFSRFCKYWIISKYKFLLT